MTTQINPAPFSKRRIEILIGILLISAGIIGGFLIYDGLSVLTKQVIPYKSISEKATSFVETIFSQSPLNVSIPKTLEAAAYKPSSFTFSIKNENKDLPAGNVMVNLEGVKNTITPNNIIIEKGGTQTFEAKLDGAPPGEYLLSLKIRGEPKIDITKNILLKSQIAVGLDEYHTYSGRISWKEGPQREFVRQLRENGVRPVIIESKFTPEILEKINVLVITMPSQPFLSDEKFSIKENLLNKGGGLLLAGDSNDYMGVNGQLNDLAGYLHLDARFNSDSIEEWTKEIIAHPITYGIETIFYGGSSLNVKEAMTTVIKVRGKDVFAVQYYGSGKIAVSGGGSIFNICYDSKSKICEKYRQFNSNLIKWLATPPTQEELEEMG